ncbi:ubiquitin-conjugating enzyme E2 Z [Rhipicephalus sanguineus]|uniref:UBC core domain-containing protein n=1 Tax=Rhipicephalus sanguineus TaxID=34632 RepID=A0A9D4PCP9_RHISA|nr:ubiquitin-conjugating enzyme E2 Z [Rhipicephalus sanguineus]KAH7935587.1 hypothetical protein HPB52_010122 [Rhipicephalus sanguineus]
MANQQGASKRAVVTPTKEVPPACLLRIKRDITELNADPPPGIFIAPQENDITKVNAIVMGPKGTPLEGGFFHLHVEFTDRYPLEPPKVRFLTTDAGRVRFNEHVYASGYICLSTLNTHGSSWSPAQSLSSLLISIQSLLSEIPKCTAQEANERLQSILEHETVRVAVCDVVEACLQEKSSFAETLKDAVLEKFPEFYDKYEGIVKSRLHLTGTKMNDPMGLNSGTYKFEELLTKLQELKAKVAEKKEAAAAKADT